MPIQTVIDGRVPVKIWTKDVEETAKNQLLNLSQLPFIYKHVSVMPDVHAGIGSTVGTVIPTKGAIIPATLGVDLGCGMMAINIGIRAEDLPDNLKSVRTGIESAVPQGRTDHGGKNDVGAWALADLPLNISEAWQKLNDDPRINQVIANHPDLIGKHTNTARHLGTLGTGNHFIEMCLDTNDNVWIMLHSGSRGIGNRIGYYFIELAKREMERWFIHLPDKDLAYLVEGSEYFKDYWNAVSWAQDYALMNRQLMMKSIIKVVEKQLNISIDLDKSPMAVNSHHNYVAMENHYGQNVYVTRKGAVRARENDLGIIPGSMGAHSFIVRGKGNRESFCSCAHGAGRRMSRHKARELYTEEDIIQQTGGVECRKDIGVVDELPTAYKDITQVMENQSDLVEIVAELHQVLCVKG